jgi:hypothetical protein
MHPSHHLPEHPSAAAQTGTVRPGVQPWSTPWSAPASRPLFWLIERRRHRVHHPVHQPGPTVALAGGSVPASQQAGSGRSVGPERRRRRPHVPLAVSESRSRKLARCVGAAPPPPPMPSPPTINTVLCRSVLISSLSSRFSTWARRIIYPQSENLARAHACLLLVWQQQQGPASPGSPVLSGPRQTLLCIRDSDRRAREATAVALVSTAALC